MDIDVGEYIRADSGYRIHTDMARFRWRGVPVEDQIEQLEGVDRDIDVEQGHVELHADQEVFEESVDEMRTNTLQDFSSPRDGGHEDGLESDAIEGMEECVNTSSSSTEM